VAIEQGARWYVVSCITASLYKLACNFNTFRRTLPNEVPQSYLEWTRVARRCIEPVYDWLLKDDRTRLGLPLHQARRHQGLEDGRPQCPP